MSIDSDVIRGHVDTIILKTLTTGDKYGFEIIKEIEQKSQGTYELKQPTLYSCLKRLENQGLISGYSKNSDIGGKRHYYKLTKKGRETYENSMQDWFNSRSIIDSLMGSNPASNNSLVEEEQETELIPETEEINFESVEEQLDEDADADTTDNSSPLEYSQEEKEVAQMIIDESSSITQESEPRNFENVNLDEEDVALLGDYYKTDENQIDLFAENDFTSFSDNEENNIENFEDEEDSDEQDELNEEDNEYIDKYNEDDEDESEEDYENNEDNELVEDGDNATEKPASIPQFRNFSGADISKYKNSSASNYFDSISGDTNDLTPVIDDSREDDAIDSEDDLTENESNNTSWQSFGFSANKDITTNNEDGKVMSENLSSYSNYNSINYFGNYGQFDEDDDENELEKKQPSNNNYDGENNLDDASEVYSYSTESEEDETSGKLHFGFGGYEENEEDDNFTIPSSFSAVNDLDDDEDNETNQDELQHPSISIFGEEDDEETSEYYDDEYPTEELNEPIYSEPQYETPTRTYISDQTTDIKPLNIGTYSEAEHKEKLNQLSSYTKSNFETRPAEYNEDTTQIEAKSIAELKTDFEELGIEIRSYKKPEKEPLKDKKYLLVNKIKFATSWIVFGIMSLLLLGVYFIAGHWGYNNLSLVTNALPAYLYYILAGVVALAVPVTYTIIYLINKTKKVKPNYNAIISLIFALLFFVVCLNIIYTFNILNGFTKFTQTDYNHLLWLLPSVVSLVIVLQSIVYTILFKTKRFNA